MGWKHAYCRQKIETRVLRSNIFLLILFHASLGQTVIDSQVSDTENICNTFEDADTVIAESTALTSSGAIQDAYSCLKIGAEKFPEFADIWVRSTKVFAYRCLKD